MILVVLMTCTISFSTHFAAFPWQSVCFICLFACFFNHPFHLHWNMLFGSGLIVHIFPSLLGVEVVLILVLSIAEFNNLK